MALYRAQGIGRSEAAADAAAFAEIIAEHGERPVMEVVKNHIVRLATRDGYIG